jgi:hypothetical protein
LKSSTRSHPRIRVKRAAGFGCRYADRSGQISYDARAPAAFHHNGRQEKHEP